MNFVLWQGENKGDRVVRSLCALRLAEQYATSWAFLKQYEVGALMDAILTIRDHGSFKEGRHNRT